MTPSRLLSLAIAAVLAAGCGPVQLSFRPAAPKPAASKHADETVAWQQRWNAGMAPKFGEWADQVEAGELDDAALLKEWGDAAVEIRTEESKAAMQAFEKEAKPRGRWNKKTAAKLLRQIQAGHQAAAHKLTADPP